MAYREFVSEFVSKFAKIFWILVSGATLWAKLFYFLFFIHHNEYFLIFYKLFAKKM